MNWKYELTISENPERIINIVKNGKLPPSELTFAAEAIGILSDSNLVRSVLVPLLKNPSAIVREGVIYGLTNHCNEEVIKLLEEISQNDPSPAIRTAASEAIERE